MEYVVKILGVIKDFNLASLITLGVVFLLFWYFQKSESLNEFCRQEIQDIDDDGREELMHITRDTISTLAMNKISEVAKCAMTKKAIVDAVLFPLIESVNSNHFTKRLMPEHYSSFRQRLFKRMQTAYSAVSIVYGDMSCKEDTVVGWKESREFCDYILTYWLSELCLSVSNSCESKIAVYGKYLPHFKTAIHYKAIAKDRIKRNVRYIEELRELHSKLKKELR